MKTITSEQAKQNYLENFGNLCPFCGSTNLTADHFETQDNHVFRNVACEGCNKEWAEEFTLTDIVINE